MYRDLNGGIGASTNESSMCVGDATGGKLAHAGSASEKDAASSARRKS
jgi:hypothetical protein